MSYYEPDDLWRPLAAPPDPPDRQWMLDRSLAHGLWAEEALSDLDRFRLLGTPIVEAHTKLAQFWLTYAGPEPVV